MMRLIFALLFALTGLITGTALAQEPRVTVTSEQDEVIVGQPYLLRIEVLVPTFMPKPPVFPTFEMPGLIVRLPEKSTSPTSKKIDGETWSGVLRTYRIYPMRAGVTEISAQQISIVYKDTKTNEDIPLTVDVPPTQIRATVPSGARALDPLIIAKDVQIEQKWQVAEGELAVGDAVVRALDISVDGTSALFVPPLLEAALPRLKGAAPDTADATEAIDAAPPFLPYPEDAKVTETLERGEMSGTRHEQVSYIAQNGGEMEFPDITVRWYSLDSEDIQEIVLEGQDVTVQTPPVERPPLDVAALIRWAVLFIVAAVLILAWHRFAWPQISARIERLRQQYAATTRAAHIAAERCAGARDLSGLLSALDERARRGLSPGVDLTQAINALTEMLYRGDAGAGDQAPQWRAIQRALRAEMPGLFSAPSPSAAEDLPALNAFTKATPQSVYLTVSSDK